MILTDEHQAIEQHTGGHALVSATAGAGKTTVLAHRVFHLLESGVKRNAILVVMFGVKASTEFNERLQVLSLARPLLPHPKAKTFNAFGLDLCRSLEQAGLLAAAEMVTDDTRALMLAKDALSLLNQTLSDDDQVDITPDSLTEFLEFVDRVKGEGVPVSQVLSYPFDPLPAPVFLRGFKFYEQVRKQRKWRTFSDQVYDPLCLMETDPSALLLVTNRFEHILVDEYQDINAAQHRLLKMVAGTRAKVMVVGDEDQCIYVWRGARPEYMREKFESEFHGAVRYPLNRTFRYGHQLALLANHVISRNRSRLPKLCIAGNDRKTQVEMLFYDKHSGDVVLDVAKRWMAAGRKLKEAVVLVREFSHSISAEITLLRAGVPYRVQGGANFLDRTEIMAMRGYLHLAGGHLADASETEREKMLAAMLSIPTLYLSKDTLQLLLAGAVANPESVPDRLLELAKVYAAEENWPRAKRLEQAAQNWSDLRQTDPSRPAIIHLAEIFERLKLERHFKRQTPRPEVAAERMRMCRQLIALATQGNHSTRSLAQSLVELSGNFSKVDEDEDALLITSIHRAKGLAWPLVIIPELTEGRFPAWQPGGEPPDSKMIEDERRLFFVAITRAKEKLVLASPEDPLFAMYDKQTLLQPPPYEQIKASRFLYESKIKLSVEAGRFLNGEVAQIPGATSIIQSYFSAVGVALPVKPQLVAPVSKKTTSGRLSNALGGLKSLAQEPSGP